jgi:hypothetical protein
MPTSPGISRRDYESLPPDVKFQALTLLEHLKEKLHRRGFTLNFLGHDGRWKDLTPWKFLSKPEDHYQRLIRGSKVARPRPRNKLLEQIAELYALTSPKHAKLQDKELEYWNQNSLKTKQTTVT